MVVFDQARWLSGRAGEDAAITAGLCTEADRTECLPNDFFIENEDVSHVQLPVHEDVAVVMQTWQMEETGTVADTPIAFDTFSGLVNNPSLHWHTLPYRVQLVDDEVIRITEVYVP